MDELGKSESGLVAARRENLAALRSRGSDPFAARRFEVEATAAELVERYGFLVPGQDAAAEGWSVAGRMLSKRTMGKSSFADLADRTGKLQLYVRREEVGENGFSDWGDLDRGDLVGVRGYMFRSKMGELTLHVKSFVPLAKALMPLPDKWHGLQDVEKRYRQRYVDMIVNPEVRDTMIMRSRLIAEARRFIDGYGFYEVETPTLLHVAGGAAARPFVTHVNALDQLMQLRIATELNLKRLIVAGLERVYEIGRIFRNEGIDTTHSPEFTMLELYAAYWDVSDMMDFNEALIAHLASVAIAGGSDLRYGEITISFARPFARIEYLEAMARFSDGKYTRQRLLDANDVQIILEELGVPPSPTHGHALDKIFERVVEPHLTAPPSLRAIRSSSRRLRNDVPTIPRSSIGTSFSRPAWRSPMHSRNSTIPTISAHDSTRRSPSAPAAMKRFQSPIGTTCAHSSTACRLLPESASALTGSSCS